MKCEGGRVTCSLPDGYAEHAPPASLRDRVACFWTRVTTRLESTSVAGGLAAGGSGVESAPAVRVLPDNCVDILFTFDGDDVAAATGVGAMTRPLLVAGPAPRLTIGVRFRPGNGHAAFGLPAGELTDETVAWAELTSDAHAELERVAAVETDRGKLDAMMALVERRLAGAATSPRYVREAVRQLERAAGGVRIAELAEGLGVSRQQLARQFAIHVGVSPKMFARVARVRATLARADAARAAHPRPIRWSALAFELGYADQPHMIEEMRALAGLTPTEWERQRTAF